MFGLLKDRITKWLSSEKEKSAAAEVGNIISPDLVPKTTFRPRWTNKTRRGSSSLKGCFGNRLKKHAIPGGITLAGHVKETANAA